MVLNKTNLLILILSICLIVSLSYIALTSLKGVYSSYYLKGVKDGKAITMNNLVNQLKTNGFIVLTINMKNQTQRIKLAPIK